MNRHCRWLLDQGYQSSFTVPLFDGCEFIGFLFYDSCSKAAFTPQVQNDLSVFSMLMTMTIGRDLSLVRSIASSPLSPGSLLPCGTSKPVAILSGWPTTPD